MLGPRGACVTTPEGYNLEQDYGGTIHSTMLRSWMSSSRDSPPSTTRILGRHRSFPGKWLRQFSKIQSRPSPYSLRIIRTDELNHLQVRINSELSFSASSAYLGLAAGLNLCLNPELPKGLPQRLLLDSATLRYQPLSCNIPEQLEKSLKSILNFLSEEDVLCRWSLSRCRRTS